MCADLVTADLFSPEFPSYGRIRLEMGLYYLHARKWLSVVPRERIHFFTLEELVAQDLRDTVGVIVDFLQLPHPHSLPTDELQCRENTQEKIDYRHDPRLMMREDTKQILEDFYQPYNQMLADLLGDDKFLCAITHEHSNLRNCTINPSEASIPESGQILLRIKGHKKTFANHTKKQRGRERN